MFPCIAPPHPALSLGARVDLPMLVVDLARRDSRRGEFTTLTLAHQSERISTSPFWPEDRFRIAGVTRGQAVRVRGEVGQFNGRRQLKVAALVALAPHEVDLRGLLPSIASAAPFWRALDRWRQAIRGPRLARTVALFFDDTAFRSGFELCPASTSGHHAELGGLPHLGSRRDRASHRAHRRCRCRPGAGRRDAA